MSQSISQLNEILGSEDENRLETLVEFATSSLENGAGDEAEFKAQLGASVLEIIQTGSGSGSIRVQLGEILATLGDPRLLNPDSADYWTPVEDDGPSR